MLESEFKSRTKDRIRERLPDVDLDFIEPKVITRSEPDLFIIGPQAWAALEFKRTKNSHKQPNQAYTIERLGVKGYASFVYPENLEEVLDDLERLFTS